jgi:hypothetical protein
MDEHTINQADCHGTYIKVEIIERFFFYFRFFSWELGVIGARVRLGEGKTDSLGVNICAISLSVT